MSIAWIVEAEGRYYVITGDAGYRVGGFGRALRAVRRLILKSGVRVLVFASSKERRRWSRVEDPEHKEAHEALLRTVERKSVTRVLTPSSSLDGWDFQKIKLPVVSKKETSRIDVYTDGSCLGNPGFGGWAFVGPDGVEKSGSALNVTNNVMEMTAVFEALKFYYAQDPQIELRIISDSRYVINGCTEWRHGWARSGWQNANGQLWKEMSRQLSLMDVTFAWVKGHNGHPQNERADTLARRAATSAKSGKH